jgi:hypothetical protein
MDPAARPGTLRPWRIIVTDGSSATTRRAFGSSLPDPAPTLSTDAAR